MRSGQEATVDVVVLQLAAVPGDVQANVERVVAQVHEHGPGADLVVAPELMTTGYELGMLREHGDELAEPVDGPSITAMSRAAVETGTTVVVGFLEQVDGLPYDSAAVLTPDAGVHVYRKSHLYPPELTVFSAGSSLAPVSTPAGTLGPLICFEHAFPDIATTLARGGADVLVIPSAVPLGFEHLLSLRTRARAQDNQVYAIGCNMSGHGFCGRSLVTDPRGQVCVEAGEDEAILHATLDLTAVARERVNEPALSLRRPELYRTTADQD